jgi:thioredoxin:protein disulfide reductase
VIIILSAIFVLLALSMFNLYELRLPVAIETRLNNLSQRQRGGTFIGVAIMGILSALIVSPCVTAPLVGALAYIGQTGDAVLGGVALLSLGIGMGIPLLVGATLGGQYLPKSGAWLNAVKAIFGVLLLAVAIWLLERVLAGPIILALWSALFIISAVYLGAFEPADGIGVKRLWKGSGLILFIYGLMLLVGAGLGNSNPFKPLSGLEWAQQPSSVAQRPNHIAFKPIKSTADLNQELMLAGQQNQPVMLEFYADWCFSCIVMQRTTFADPNVIEFISQNFIPLQADVTANDTLDKELQRNLSIFAPPAILFFDSNGEEIRSARIVGEIGPTALLQHLQSITA